LYQKAYTPWEWHNGLKKMCDELGLVFFSSPFDVTAVDFLEKLNVPAYKIASFEIADIPLIKYVASKMKPVIISTGIATFEEIQGAVDACYAEGNRDVILLKCCSSYPAPVEEANLLTLVDLAKKFKVPVGLSDHTMDPSVAVASVALGARLIEKHIILDRSLGGPDAGFSIEPAEFKQLVDSVRAVEKALGRVTYDLSEKVKKNRVFSRSLFAVQDIHEGEFFTKENIRSIRPGHGLSPKYYEGILGRKAACPIEKGTPLTFDVIN
jgi:pseudaminic acid synthase